MSVISVAWSSAGDRARRPSARWAPIDRRLARRHAPAGIAVVGQREQLAPGRPTEHPHQGFLAKRRDLAHGGDAVAAELGRGHVAHSPQPLDRQRVQKGQLRARRDHEHPVGLCDPTGDLGQELRAREPDRDRQPDLVADLGSQTRGDLRRRPRNVLKASNVEKCLVDRQRLDERRGALEDREHLPCWPPSTRTCAAARPPRAGTGPAPARLPSPSSPRRPWPRSLPRARRLHLRSPAVRAATDRRAARPTHRTSRGPHA